MVGPMTSTATTIDPRQEWSTPEPFMRVIRDEFAPGLDVCATFDNKKCDRFYGPPGYRPPGPGDGWCGENGLENPWWIEGVVWCNPGFSDVLPWMRKAIRESANNPVTVLLLTHASHADWAQLGWRHAAECRLLYPRLQFDPAPGIPRSSNPRDAVLWIFRPQYTGPCHLWPWGWNDKSPGRNA